ncbi:Site-specific tyrosine recombinase XerC, partial [Durusdinium trenchii]
MHQFKTRFLSSPLPSKMSRLFRRAKRGDRRATRVLSALGLPWRELCHLDQQRRYSAVTDRFLSGNVPAEAVFLLPRAATFNSTRRTIEAILSTVGPARHGKPFALGYLDDVPCCRPEDEDEPDVIVASLDEVSAIYRACSNVDWPDRRKTGVPAPDLWRALLVWLYNVATRRTDFLMLRKAQIRLDSRGQDGLVLLRQNKTGKSRWLPLNETVVRHLRLIWHSKGPRVFPFPDNRHALYGRWREIQKAAGIHVDRPDWSDRHDVYSFHELRKTSLGEYFVINEGVAQQMGCHAQLATTLKHYVPAVRKDGKLREAVTQLPTGERWPASRSAASSIPREPLARSLRGIAGRRRWPTAAAGTFFQPRFGGRSGPLSLPWRAACEVLMTLYVPKHSETRDIVNRFTFHPPHGDQVRRYESLREQARGLAFLILQGTPPSREQSLALTKLEEVVMWANAAIARNEP